MTQQETLDHTMNHLEVDLSGQRKSSIHVDIEIPDRTQNLDRTPNNPSEVGRRSEVNCPFTFYRKGSPRAKRRRENEKEDADKRTMKTFADPRENPTYEAETFALSGIIQYIKEKHIIELLDKFSPVIRAFPDQIKKEMLEFSFEWVNRKKILIEAINYVRYGKKDHHENEQQLREISIEKLTEIFIIEIENRMPKFCQYCKQHYIVDIRDSPDINCMWCKVGMHDCISLNELKNRPGFKWLCESCEPSFNVQYLAKLDPAVAIFDPTDSFEGFGKYTHSHSEIDQTIQRNKGEAKDKEDEDEVEILEINNPSPKTNPKTTTTVIKHAYSGSRKDKVIERKEGQEGDKDDAEEERNVVRPIAISKSMMKEQEELNKIQVVAEIHNDGTNTRNHSSYSGLQARGNGISQNYDDEKEYPNLNKKKICHFLIKGICRFGARGENQYGKCDKYHPIHCRAYNLNGTMENGCKNGNKCKEWHATYICRSSANSRNCTRPACPFKHHKDCYKQSNDSNNFLVHQNHPMMPRQHPISNIPITSHSQHQQHRHHRFKKNNYSQPPYHRQPYYHRSHAPQEHLVHMIRKIIREENQYQPRR